MTLYCYGIFDMSYPDILNKAQFHVTENPCELTQLTENLKHYNLYDFWLRSQGIWFSKLVKVAVKVFSKKENIQISQIHHLAQVEFGVSMSWEYYTKPELGHMSWCVDSNQSNLIFTDQSISSDTSPQIFNYQMVNDNKLIVTNGKYEEMFVLDSNSRRLRELKCEGKLIRRIWENKFAA
jgi:hypothetical protein